MAARNMSLVLVASLLAGCAAIPPTPADPRDQFMAALTRHCGKAFAGQLVTGDAADADMRGKPLVMHVRRCSRDRVEIPFHVGGTGKDGADAWDRSRTWIITRTADGLRLKHDHRHADGTKDAMTLYGGDTAAPGSAERQAFPVDSESIALFRAEGRTASVTNIWTIEVTNTRFAYELRREGRHCRVEFDLSKTVDTPPAPWGW